MSAPSTDEAGIRQIARALNAAGYVFVGVDNGDGIVPVSTVSEVVDEATAADDAHLFVVAAGTHGEKAPSWVWFVLGNDPEEVVADHTIDLSHVIDPVMDRWV